MAQLGEALRGAGAAVVTQAVYGLGGIGKSELALQHARAQPGYSLRWWITAEHPAGIQAGLADLTARLCPAIRLAGTTAEAAAWAMGWLQAHRGWLLVLDNVSDFADISPLLSQLDTGHILITTRRDTGWDKVATLRLDILDPGSAVNLLTQRTRHHVPADQVAAAAIAAELGYLPLALDQAAAYITQTRIPLVAYLGYLRRRPATMYESAGAAGHPQRCIARIWDVTFEAIQAADPSAVHLLHVLACYAPDNIPRALLDGGDDSSRIAIDQALGLLASYSMITLTTDSVSMHRLVQAVLLSRECSPTAHAAEGKASPRDTALALLEKWAEGEIELDTFYKQFLARQDKGRLTIGMLLPHAEHLVSLLPAPGPPLRLAWVLGYFGRCGGPGRDIESLAMFQAGRAILEEVLGPEHPATALAVQAVAVSYHRVGRAAEALPLFERAVATFERELGAGHPATAAALSGQAAAHSALGQHNQALPLAERALEIAESALGPLHSDTISIRRQLGSVHHETGHSEKAAQLEAQADSYSYEAYVRFGNNAHASYLRERARHRQERQPPR